MKTKLISIVLLLFPSLCAAQADQSISLKNANFSLSLPAIVASEDGTLYIAFRSFDWLKRSKQLVVLAYDIKSSREIRRSVFNVPTVHGPRVANGLYMSKDGQLAYAELHNPCLTLLISTHDLSEIRRSNSPLFTSKDSQETFAGFDNNGFLSFASDSTEGLRFIRVEKANLQAISNTTANSVHQERSQSIVWSPGLKRTWVFKPSATGSSEWLEYTEEGRETGQKLIVQEGGPNGAAVTGENRLLAFFGNMSDAGTLVGYDNHRTTELKMRCLPHKYGVSDDRQYIGAICTTSPNREPERGGNKIVTSDFLLLSTKIPRVVWRHEMNYADLTENGRDEKWFHQVGAATILQSGGKAWIVAPSKSPDLSVFQVPLTEGNASSKPTTP